MSLNISSSSTSWTSNPTAFAICVYPFTVGFWVYIPSISANMTIWSECDTGTTNNYYSVRATTTAFTIVARGGGTENSGTATASLLTGAWNYVIARFISATNRRISVFNRNGIVHAQVTTNTTKSATGMENIGYLRTSAGITEQFTGYVGELWMALKDIQGDGAQLLNSTLVSIAFNGPLKYVNPQNSLAYYFSFKQKVSPMPYWDYGEAYMNNTIRALITNWTSLTTTPTWGPHPILKPTYFNQYSDTSNIII